MDEIYRRFQLQKLPAIIMVLNYSQKTIPNIMDLFWHDLFLLSRFPCHF